MIEKWAYFEIVVGPFPEGADWGDETLVALTDTLLDVANSVQGTDGSVGGRLTNKRLANFTEPDEPTPDDPPPPPDHG